MLQLLNQICTLLVTRGGNKLGQGSDRSFAKQVVRNDSRGKTNVLLVSIRRNLVLSRCQNIGTSKRPENSLNWGYFWVTVSNLSQNTSVFWSKMVWKTLRIKGAKFEFEFGAPPQLLRLSTNSCRQIKTKERRRENSNRVNPMTNNSPYTVLCRANWTVTGGKLSSTSEVVLTGWSSQAPGCKRDKNKLRREN